VLCRTLCLQFFRDKKLAVVFKDGEIRMLWNDNGATDMSDQLAKGSVVIKGIVFFQGR